MSATPEQGEFNGPPATPDEEAAPGPAQGPTGTDDDGTGDGGTNGQWMLLEPVDTAQHGISGRKHATQRVGFTCQLLPLTGDASTK